MQHRGQSCQGGDEVRHDAEGAGECGEHAGAPARDRPAASV